MAEWREARLRDICTGIFDCPHSTPALTESGPYVVRTQDIRSGTFRADEAAHVSEATYQERIARAEPSPGDILFSREGTYFGVAAEIPQGIRVCLGQRMVLIRPDPSIADARFVRYWLNSPAMAAHIRGYRDGSVAERLNLPTIRDLPVALPPLSRQRRVAGILGALDDKIELNRRAIATLVEMARALFDASFGTPEAEDAPTVLGDLADVIDCLHAKKPDRRDVGRPLLHLGNIRDDGLLDISDAYLIDDRDYEVWTSRVEARPGDCVITNVGRVGAVAQIPSGVSAALGRNMTAVRCRPDFPYPTFVLEALRSDAMRAEIERKTDAGTILSALNVRNIPRLQLPALDRDRIEQYERVARPLRARMETALAENQALRKTRDALVPRLLSGAVPA